MKVIYSPNNEPLTIHVWSSPERVKQEIDAAFALLKLAAPKGMQTVRDHLAETIAVVGIQIQFPQLKDMGIVYAYEIARWYGRQTNALILGDENQWSLIKDGFLHL